MATSGIFIELWRKRQLSNHALKMWKLVSGQQDFASELKARKKSLITSWLRLICFILVITTFFVLSGKSEHNGFTVVFALVSLLVIPFAVQAFGEITGLESNSNNRPERQIEVLGLKVARLLEIPTENALTLSERALAERADEVLISTALRMLREEKRCRDEGRILAESARWELERKDLQQKHEIFKDFIIADANWTRYIREAERRLKQSEQDKQPASRTKSHGASAPGQEPSYDSK